MLSGIASIGIGLRSLHVSYITSLWSLGGGILCAMKKYLSLLLAAAFAVFAAVSCDEKLPSAPETPPAERLALNLSANIAQFTKATDTEFEYGDAVGVSIVVPDWESHNASLYAHNVRYSIWGDGTMNSDIPLYWYDNVNQSGYVMSYYPYSSSYRINDGFEFTVSPDQYFYWNYTNSDLMFACTAAKPTEDAVKLTYNHLLSKVVVYVDNKLDDAISEVFISDVYGTVKVDVDVEDPAEYTILGDKDMIRMCPATDASGRSVWAAITVPQASVSPKLIVTTVSSRQYTFALTEPVTFRAGTKSTAEIVLDDSSLFTTFTPEVSDWLPGNDLDFGQISDPSDWRSYHYSSEGDFEFLKWLVDNRAYGDVTPTLADLRSCNFGEFVGISFGQDAAGKWYISEIYYFANVDNPSSKIFNSFPPTLDLPRLERIYINCTADGTDAATAPEWMKCPLKGSELPTEWNCPNLWGVHLECTGMTGVIPDSFATLPNLAVIFFRYNDFYGALPHDWASTSFECIRLAYLGRAGDSPNLGYVLPASLDIILNSEKPDDPRERDQNEIHIGHADNIANWKGYENGWGQKRYVKFGGGAEGDLTTWSPYRKLTAGTAEEVAPGGLRNPKATDIGWYIDDWPAWYRCCVNCIPETMVEWNQADADAFTAEMAARPRIFTRE